MLKYAFTALLCLPYACGSEARAATPAETWLKAHNVARCIHGVPPLRWSSTVAASAQRWANSCNFYHNAFRDGYGENLAWGTTGYMTAERSAYLWYRENQGYPYGASTPPYETMHLRRWSGQEQVSSAVERGFAGECRSLFADIQSLETTSDYLRVMCRDL